MYLIQTAITAPLSHTTILAALPALPRSAAAMTKLSVNAYRFTSTSVLYYYAAAIVACSMNNTVEGLVKLLRIMTSDKHLEAWLKCHASRRPSDVHLTSELEEWLKCHASRRP